MGADSDGFTSRNLRVKNLSSQEEREVVQLQFTAWPDHGVPEDTLQFLHFVQKKRDTVESLGGANVPVLIHCSAGVGRTGVFCLTEYALSCVEQERPLQFAKALHGLRKQRPQLIQNDDQYKFCYSVVLDALSVDANEDNIEFDDNVGSSVM